MKGRALAGAAAFVLALLSAVPARADDTAACIAASEQSLTSRKQGKLHDALRQLAVCAAPACPAEVVAECTKRIEAVKLAMPTLILGAKDGAGNDIPTAKVTMDGAELSDALSGRPLAVDPGEHVFVFTAPGQPPVTKQLVVREGEKDRRETVVIGPVVVAPPVPPPSTVEHPKPSSWSTQRTLAVVSGSVGVVGLALGGVFGGYALSAQNREKTDCSASGCPNRAQGSEDYTTAVKNANASTGLLVAGGALLATGIVVWFTAPKPKPAPTSARSLLEGLHLSPTVGGLVLGGELW